MGYRLGGVYPAAGNMVFQPPDSAAGKVQTHEQTPVASYVFAECGLQTVGRQDGGGGNIVTLVNLSDNGKEVSDSVYTGLVEQ